MPNMGGMVSIWLVRAKKKARPPLRAGVPLHREASDSRPAAAGCQGDSMPRVSDVP